MKTESFLDEVWNAKDELAREAGNDIHAMCENARKWIELHPHRGPVANNAEELRLLANAASPVVPLAVHESPPHYGEEPKRQTKDD